MEVGCTVLAYKLWPESSDGDKHASAHISECNLRFSNILIEKFLLVHRRKAKKVLHIYLVEVTVALFSRCGGKEVYNFTLSCVKNI